MKLYGPLRGRDDALATSLGTVHRTRVHGASGVVLITGDPGIENPRCCRRCVATQRTCGSESPEASATRSSRRRPERRSPGCCAAGVIPCSRPRNTRKSMADRRATASRRSHRRSPRVAGGRVSGADRGRRRPLGCRSPLKSEWHAAHQTSRSMPSKSLRKVRSAIPTSPR
jgi:hypothetical protein